MQKCHFLTESGLKKDIFMSSNLSVPLAERVFFLLGVGGGGGSSKYSTTCENSQLYFMSKHNNA